MILLSRSVRSSCQLTLDWSSDDTVIQARAGVPSNDTQIGPNTSQIPFRSPTIRQKELKKHFLVILFFLAKPKELSNIFLHWIPSVTILGNIIIQLETAHNALITQ